MSALTLPQILAGPMSRPEFRLWRWLLGEEKLQKLRREIRGLMRFQQSKYPFGPSSGGAGGNVGTAVGVAGAGIADGIDSGSHLDAAPHLWPPRDFQPFDKYGTLALPAAAGGFFSIGGTSPGTQNASSSMPFQVPPGFNGFVKTIANDFVANGGAAWTQGVLPAALFFSITRNQNAVPDYGNFAYSSGVVQAPTAVAGFPVKEQETIFFNVSNVSIVVTTQFVEARLQGYFYGKHLEPKELWQT